MSKNKLEVINSDLIAEAKKTLNQVGDGKISKDIYHMLMARYSLLYIQSHEEDRVIECFEHLSVIKGYNLIRWDCTRGLCDVDSHERINDQDNELHSDAAAVLSYIIDKAKAENDLLSHQQEVNTRTIFFLLDFHHFINVPLIERKFREFAKIQSRCFIVIISPVFSCPPTLDKLITLVDFPMPSVSELKSVLDKLLDDTINKYPNAKEDLQDTAGKEEEVINAAKGLTIGEASNAYAKSLIKHKILDPSCIVKEKKQIIQKTGILQYIESRYTFDNVGGLNSLKEWLQMRKLAFKEDALSYGLPCPRGVLLIGIPGTGKSLVAEALSSYYEMPLLRLDVGSIFSSHVGESEANVRTVTKTCDAISPCILWIDEIEKALGGVQSSNQTDGGVGSRVFGTLLTWLQDKKTSVFVVATANNLLELPPEFMRAGRFDEVFFLDLPDEPQRKDVIEKILKKKKRDGCTFNVDKIAQLSDHYSPAELEKAIDNGLFVAYSDNRREVTTDDIISEMQKFQPIYQTRKEEIESMREWALGSDGKGGRARLANSVKKISAKPLYKKIDLEADDL